MKVNVARSVVVHDKVVTSTSQIACPFIKSVRVCVWGGGGGVILFVLGKC